MPLNPRQQRAYKERANLWAPVYQIDPVTKEQVTTGYTPFGTNVPCLLVQNQSTELPTVGTRIEQSNIFTRDEWHFDISVPIRSGWIIKDVTVDEFGQPSPNNGRFWVVAGDSQNFPALGGRRANCRVIRAVIEPPGLPPDGVS